MKGTATPGVFLIRCYIFHLLSSGCSGSTELQRHSFLSKVAKASTHDLDGSKRKFGGVHTGPQREPRTLPDSLVELWPFSRRVHQKTSKNTAKVEVYYETYCPYCVQFLNGSLRQAWEDVELRERMSLDLHPFGNGRLYPEERVSEGYHFWHQNASYPLIECQHKEQECLGNTIHACAVADLEASKYMPFLLCMVSYGVGAGPELTSYACGTKLGVDMPALKACATSRRGHNLHVAHGQRTHEKNLTSVPVAMVNGQRIDNGDKGDLIRAVCGVLDGQKPAACSKVVPSQGPGHNSTGKKKKGCGGSGSL